MCESGDDQSIINDSVEKNALKPHHMCYLEFSFCCDDSYQGLWLLSPATCLSLVDRGWASQHECLYLDWLQTTVVGSVLNLQVGGRGKTGCITPFPVRPCCVVWCVIGKGHHPGVGEGETLLASHAC